MDAVPNAGDGAHLLVVDDDALARQLVGDVLESEGYRVTPAGDGEEALEIVGDERIDLVLADWRMPRLDGLGLVKRLAESEEPSPPIIMLTSIGATERMAEALDAGADDYIVKPVDRNELLARVRLALRGDRVRAAAEQAALRAIAEAVARARPPEQIMDLVAEQVAQLHRGAAGAVAQFESDEVVYLGRWTRDPGSEAVFGGSIPITSGLPSALVATSGAPARVDDIANLDPEVVPPHALGRLRGAVAAPIMVGGDLWGAVIVGTVADQRLPAGTEKRLARFGDLVALAIDSAAARDVLTTRAGTDSLTGLPNRRVFFERLEGEAARARRHGRELSVAIIDIDHFKAVNDGFGHQTGDAVLRELGWRLAEAARSGDVLGRIGGEEFGWLLPETDAMEAWQAAERARVAVAGAAFPAVGRITISAGLCEMAHSSGPDDLYAKADAALYWAKNQGRDVVFLYAPEVMEVLSEDERARQLRRNQALQSVRTLARAVDSKDASTRRHSERVADLAESLAIELGWTQVETARLREAALVHDVGKIAVPDALLFKSERLTAAELARVRVHASLGADVVGDIFDAEQAAWVRGHHERWDGTGYPDGLTRDEAPEGARILHLADAFEVMTSPRPYTVQMTHEEAMVECRGLAAEQFWPRAIEALGVLYEDGRIATPLDPAEVLAEGSAD